MVRVKRGNVAQKRRKKILSLASGYRGAHSVLFRVANQQVMKALRYSYIGRKQKKRIFRKKYNQLITPEICVKVKRHQSITLSSFEQTIPTRDS